MGRLHAIHLHTPELARQREFYAVRLAVGVAGEDGGRVRLDTRGAALELVAAPAAKVEWVLALRGVASRLATLASRGVTPEGTTADAPGAPAVVLRDPEGIVVHVVEDAGAPAGRWPELSHLVINAADFSRTTHFYRDLLGLRVADDRGPWIEFDTGACRLLVHDRGDAAGLALVSDQRVTFALGDDDLDAWAEQLRGAGMVFATAPMDEELGRVAEVEDADGWFVMLRGPGTELGAEEDLAADFESDEDDDHSGLRRAVDPSERAQRPGFGSRKLTRRKPERVPTRGFDAPAPPSSREMPRPGGFGPPRPFVPRPDGPGAPRPGAPRPAGPGPPRPWSGPGAPGPRGPAPGGPRPFPGPRPGGPPAARPPFGGPPRRDGPRSAPPPRRDGGPPRSRED